MSSWSENTRRDASGASFKVWPLKICCGSNSASKLNRVNVCLQPENGTAAKVRPVPFVDLSIGSIEPAQYIQRKRQIGPMTARRSDTQRECLEVNQDGGDQADCAARGYR